MKALFTMLFIVISTLSNTQAQMKNNSQPVAFAATITDKTAAQAAIANINKQAQPLKNAGIENLHFFTQTVDSKEIILATMDLDATNVSKSATEAWNNITKSPLFKEKFTALEQVLSPHQRHADDPTKSPWILTENICKLRPSNAADAKVDSPWYAAVTGLKPEKEADYRLLHNNVWPGVIDAIGASNISRFDIFLIEFGDNQPHLFYLFQYTGADLKADMAAQPSSPVNRRWWKFTDACQKPLPGATDGPWLNMNQL